MTFLNNLHNYFQGRGMIFFNITTKVYPYTLCVPAHKQLCMGGTRYVNPTSLAFDLRLVFDFDYLLFPKIFIKILTVNTVGRSGRKYYTVFQVCNTLHL